MRTKRSQELEKKFDHFFLKYYPRVKGFALKILMSEADAEDVSQDIFVKLLDRPDFWDTDSINDGYLFTMTKNHIFNILKRQKVENKYQEKIIADSNINQQSSLLDELYAKELELIALKTIENMPVQRKKIFKMSRLQGKSNDTISKTLDLSIRTVERHIYLALSDLKKALNVNKIAILILTFIN